MTSVLRQLQAEWNTLVPEAQARGIRRVRTLNAPLETIDYRRGRLEWLRAQLGTSAITAGVPQPLGSIEELTFGVELELMMPVGMGSSELARMVTRGGVPCVEESYNHGHRNHWKIVTDGSLGDYTRGREVVSPILQGQAGFEALRKVCRVLQDAGCKVSKKCGMHVHVGARSESVQFFKNLAVLYASAQVAIDSFMAPSRRGESNMFCRPVSLNRPGLNLATTLDQVARAVGQNAGTLHVRGSGRYCKLNFQSFWQHGTVEFRHHQGTVEADKAENWVRLCLRMCLTARGTEKTAHTVEELMAAVEATEGEKDFFAGRVRWFSRGERPPASSVRAAVTRTTSVRAEVAQRVQAFDNEAQRAEVIERATQHAQAVTEPSDVFSAWGDRSQTPTRNR